jgi:signal transduction histidine kinase
MDVRRTLLPLALLATVVAAALLLAGDVREREDRRLSFRMSETVAAVEGRLDAYAGVLYSVRGLFEASVGVSRAEFHRHVASVEVRRRFPGVTAVGFAEEVPTGDEADYERRVDRDARASGLPDPPMQIRGTPSGPVRLIVSYLEPQEGNLPAFGFDLLSEPERRAAVELTEETDRPAATAPLRLMRESGPQQGFLIVLGVGGSQRGVAYAAFEMDTLMRGLTAGGLPDADLRIRDGDEVVYDTGMDAEYGSRSEEIDAFGRSWTLRYAPREDLLSTTERLAPWLVLVGGAVLAVITLLLLLAAAETERRATALADQRTAELARSNADLARFAYVASHDLREPLRSVTGFLGLLSRRYGERLDDDGRQWIAYAQQGSRRMDALIAALLAYSRLGRPESPEGERADLAAAYATAVEDLRASIADSGAEVSAGPLPTVAAGQGEMVQLMQNLLANALKYCGPLPPVVRVEAVARNGKWEISVADNGIGIDPRHHGKIFEHFQRLHSQDDYEGTGMGLTICKKIVEARGGSIAVDSTPGHGSRFVITLPRVEEPA